MTGTAGRVDFLGFALPAVVIVTGAASGIGRATAGCAHRLGLTVAAWDIAPDGLAALASELGNERVVTAVADISDRASVEAAFASTADRVGDIAYLVNNASPPQFAELSYEDGVRAALGGVGIVTETWLSHPGSVGGAVVSVASVAGNLVGTGSRSWYPSSKAGVAGYTRWLAVHAPNGIRANAVAPGRISTPRTSAVIGSAEGQAFLERIPSGRNGEPEDLAKAILFLLSPAADYINGVLLPVDGAACLVW